jgi:lysozyme family protein
MDNYNKALQFVLKAEGGYVNDPDDKGGATNKGITQSNYNAYRRMTNKPIQSVHGITDSEVSEIYFKNYWQASGADKITDFKLALMMFDTSVNMGTNTAKILLNESKNNFDAYYNLRKALYERYATDKIQRKFLQGWLNRLEAVKNYK